MKILPQFLKDTNELCNECTAFVNNFDEYVFPSRTNIENDPLESHLKLLHAKYDKLGNSIESSYPLLLKGFLANDITKNKEAEAIVSPHLLTAPLLYLTDIISDFENLKSQYKKIFLMNRIDSSKERLNKGLRSLLEVINWSKKLVGLILFELQAEPAKLILFGKSLKDLKEKILLTRQP